MNVISGLGGAAKSLTIRFLADTAKGIRDVDKYFAHIRRGIASVSGGRMFPGSLGMQGLAITGGLRGGLSNRYYGAGMLGGGGALLESSRKTNQMMGQTRETFNRFNKAGKNLNNTLGRTVLTATRARTAFGTLGGVLQSIPAWAKAAIIALFGFREAFKHGIMAESSKIIMETLTGSEKRAVDLIAKAREYSVRTLFKPEEVLGATTTAIQRGIDPYKRGAYGLAANKNAMDIFAGLGSMMNPLTGKVLGVNRMTEAILRGDYRLLRPVRGIINPAYEAAQKSGFKVGTPGFNERFIEELGKIPAIMELAKKQSESIQGLWSTISGLWQEFWMDFSGATQEEGLLTFWSQVKDILLQVRDAALAAYVKMRPFIMEVGALFGTIFKFFYTIYKNIFSGAGGFGDILIQLLRIMVQVASLLLNTLIKIMEFGGRMAQKLFGTLFSGMVERAVKKLSEFVTGLQMFIQWWGMFLDTVAKRVEGFVDRIILKFKTLVRTVTDFMRNFPVVGKVWDKIFNYLMPEKPDENPESPPPPSPEDVKNYTTPPRSEREREKAITEISKSISTQNNSYSSEVQYMMLNALYSIDKNVKKTNDQLINGDKAIINKNNSSMIPSNLAGNPSGA
jgi:hypothetical protein